MAVVAECKAEHCPFSSATWLLTRINNVFPHLNLEKHFGDHMHVTQRLERRESKAHSSLGQKGL